MTGTGSVRASMDFNSPLNALSTSRNNRLIAVGGRDVLKIVALEATGFTEKRNLRVVGKPSLNFSTNDIRWHPHLDYILATAATNGAVVIWNLERDGYKHVQERVLHGHRRAVNRICWHPSDWNVLISGSQDGTVKLWDKRGGKVVSTYQPKSESVRDVRTSPFHHHQFAAAFENGLVHVWDLRKTAQPAVKFTAHKGLVLSLDWHPSDANVLASGGRDRYVKIWQLRDVKQPNQTIQTIASVGRVAWRPTCVTHVATSASLMDNSIHLWDTKRPFIPIASLKGHCDIASGISWIDTPVHEPDQVPGEWEGHKLWQHMLACSKDGTLKLHSLADAFKPHESLRTTALALNSKGHVAFSHDYIDRSCASLKLHGHRSGGNSLFTVAGVSSSSSFSPSFGPFNSDRKEAKPNPLLLSLSPFQGSVGSPDDAPTGLQDQVATRTTAWSFGTGQSLPPKALHRSSGSSTNLLGFSSVPSSTSASSKSTTGTSTCTTNLQALQGMTTLSDGNKFVAVSCPSASLTSASPQTPQLSGLAALAPRAVVNLVTLQNVFNANQLEELWFGDETAYVQASHHLDVLRAQFEHSEHLKDSFGFDEHAFRFLAKHYLLFFPDDRMAEKQTTTATTSQKYAAMCAQNAVAALVTGNAHVCHMWRLLHVLYTNKEVEEEGDGDDQEGGETFMSPRESTHDDRLKEFLTRDERVTMDEGQASGRRETAMLLEQLDHVNPQAMEGFFAPCVSYPSENERRRREESDWTGASTSSMATTVRGNASMMMNGSAVKGELGHVRDAMLKEVLEYYTDIGDLQTCVAITVVVGLVTNVENVMGKAWIQQISMHYIDLLHQLQLYTTANELVANCTDPSIRQMNMKSTSVYFNCARCSKPLEAVGPSEIGIPVRLCANCNNAATLCSICQLPVRGLYVWCPVCAHGGHLDHLTEWFARETVCPTGCSHRCSLNFVPTGEK